MGKRLSTLPPSLASKAKSPPAGGSQLPLRIDQGGDERDGLAIFCGGVRFFGVRWGFRRVRAGLRQAGFKGRLIYDGWHSAVQGWLVLPPLTDRALIERRAGQVAECIEDYGRRYPHCPVYLLGCSAGGFLALRALELLGEGVQIESAALLSPAFDGRRDLAPALSHLKGRLVVTYSSLDWIVLGLGTLLFGNADGRYCRAAGLTGVLGDYAGKVLNMRWRPGMILSGRLGGHVSAIPSSFIARYVAPAMGIGTL